MMYLKRYFPLSVYKTVRTELTFFLSVSFIIIIFIRKWQSTTLKEEKKKLTGDFVFFTKKRVLKWIEPISVGKRILLPVWWGTPITRAHIMQRACGRSISRGHDIRDADGGRRGAFYSKQKGNRPYVAFLRGRPWPTCTTPT